MSTSNIISSIFYPNTNTKLHPSSNTTFMVKTLPSLLILVVALFLLLTLSSSFPNQVLAFGESPIGNLDAIDLTLPPLADFDERINRYNEWMNQSSDVERGLFVPFELVREKSVPPPASSDLLSSSASSSSSGERSRNTLSEMMMNNNNIHEYHLKMIAKRNIGTRQPEVRIPAKMILSYHTICPKAAKRRILKATIAERRRNLTNYHSSLREQQELSEKEQELEDMMHVSSSSTSTNENGNVEPFCIISEYLYDLASEQETCSLQKEQGRFESGFEQTMLTLFIAYSRWGNHSGFSEATTSPAYDFFKPMIDLFPRVPASPVCTFTDFDLSIFPQANEIKNERMKLETQWKHSILGRIFDNNNDNSDENNSKNTEQQQQEGKNFRTVTNADGTTRKLELLPDAEADIKEQELKERVRSLFHTMFPEDSLTLPRFFWASCVLKSRVTNCFTSGVPCLFPVLDLAEYRTELTTYTPRVTDWNTVRGFKTFLAYVERPGEGSNTLNGPGEDDEKDDTSRNVDQKQQEQQNEEESPLKKKKKKLRKLRNRKKSNTNTNEEEINNNEENNKNERKKQQQEKPRGMMKIFPRDNFFQSTAARDTPDNVLALLQFDTPVKAGHELRLDRERRALPFIHSGVIDKNDHLKCVSVRLPTQSMYNKYVEHIVNKADELKSISPKDIFDDPADIHIAPLFSECIDFIFDKSEPLLPPPVNGDDETSSNNSNNSNNTKKQEAIPFTCLHANPNTIQQLAQWITRLGLYDQTCTRQTLETQPAVEEDTPENALRSVALLGKLVRSQLERVSKSLSKIEPYISKFRLLGGSSDGASRKDKTGAFASVNDDPSTMKNLFKKQEMAEEEEIDRIVDSSKNKNKNKKKSKKSKKKQQKEQALREYRKMVEEDKKKNIFTSSSTSEDKQYQQQQQQLDTTDETTLQNEQQQQQQPPEENQKHADSNNNGDDDSSSVVSVDETDDDDDATPSSKLFLSKSFEEELSSCSPESPTTCRILQDPRLPRHALLIHEWLLNEHDGLLKIYDTLTSMRDVVRKAAASYHRASSSSSSSSKGNQQRY